MIRERMQDLLGFAGAALVTIYAEDDKIKMST